MSSLRACLGRAADSSDRKRGMVGSPGPPLPSKPRNGMEMAKIVGICETQPVTAEGLKSLLRSSEEFECLEPVGNLQEGLDLALRRSPDVMVVDKAFGTEDILELLSRLRVR